jgi:hypothetical protein
MKYTITQSRLLYVLSINDRKHANLLKVGEVFVDNEIADDTNKQVLFKAVRDILDKRSYMQGVNYHLEHVECTTYNQSTKCYKADDVYRTLNKMGIPSTTLNKFKSELFPTKSEDADIWYHCFLAEIQEAINKIKNGQVAGYGAIKFRPEQDMAIGNTVAHFRKPNGKAFLWNAKMRFGKTLSGLEVAKQLGYKSTLIITHRPVVDKGWHDDFKKIFGNMPEYVYATRMSDDDATGGDFYHLTKQVDAGKKRLVFFVSMQYLRLSQYVGGKERNLDPLKKAIMKYDWDFVMVDEAHEGIEAAAGIRVMEKLKKENTRILSLSGTPFNLLDKYDEGEIYTWDYVMEQRAKQEWDEKHFGDPNPYAELPRMQILTFTLPKMVRDEAIENNEIFKFHEFFRVWTEEDKKIYERLIEDEKSPLKREELKAKMAEIKVDKFIHEGAVRRFVEKLHTKSDTSQYPFSDKEFRDKFRHTFWLLPGVKEAAALEEILKEDKIFGEGGKLGFHIINAAGDGNIEDKDGSALAEVEDNLRGYDPSTDPDRERAKKKKAVTAKERTITLSCGKLTTGVSVPEWTAVLCMKGSENTPAANYMQTIFRVQTHAVLNGRQKSDCYVFDFAPDRALTAVAETAKMAVDAQGAGKKQMKRKQKEEEEHLQAFIKLCPVLSMDEGEMGKHFSANQIFEKLSNVYIERAVRSGYADNSLYNPDQLLNLTPEQEKALGDVHDLLGSMPAGWKPEKININKNGLGNTEGAEMIKYIYYLTSQNVIPPRPVMSAESDDNGCPMTDTEGWDDKMCAPTQIFPYLFVSNSRFIEDQWTDFSKPVLWKEWTDPEKNTDEAKKKREQENKEKRARMSVLRGVAIRIPLLVYGAEINDEDGEEITIDNFASEEIVDQASWDEFMPKGFTKETFNILKDCFDRSIFTGAAKRIRQMVKEADNLNTEDRIAKIATIFSYFHNPDKETVLTPWKVVNRHMSDCLGGWCFFNEEFDAEYTEENEYGENIKMARPVGMKIDENGKIVFTNKVTQDIFGDYNARILEINSKTGLYPLYMAYSLFKTSKEPEWRRLELTGERGMNKDAVEYEKQASDDLIIWRDVLQDNIFVVCRTKMAVSITKRTLAGFRKDIRMNVKCYERDIEINDLISSGVLKKEADGITKDGAVYKLNAKSSIDCDMITVLRSNPELFQSDVVKGIDFWNVYNSIPRNANEDINNMKFKAIVGNPPYQIMDGGNGASDAAAPIYNKFVEVSEAIAPNYLSMIMPSKWMVGGRSELSSFLERMKDDIHLSYMKDYRNDRTIFPSAHNDGGICYFLWDAQKTMQGIDYNYITMDGDLVHSNAIKNRFTSYIIRDTRVIPILEKVFPTEESLSSQNRFSSIVSKTRPFGLRKDIFNSPENYPDSEMNSFPFNGSVKIYGVKGKKGGAKRMEGYITEKIITDKYDAVDKYKLFFTTTYSSDAVIPPDIIRGYKRDTCTETFLLIGPFETEKEMENCAAYVESNFFRFLLFLGHGTMQVNQSVFSLIPIQNFKEPISDTDLYKKYGLDISEQNYINSLIRPAE